jgi:histidine phosphotransferase ChpT
MDDTLATRLADALCARVCHDLAGPLGTLIGTLELAASDPDSVAEALPLASETAILMGLRLQLLRAAWAGDCGPLTARTLAKLAAGLPPRVHTELRGLDEGEFPAPVARVLVNMLLLGAEALPRGGTVSLSGGPDQDVLLVADGKDAAWPPGLLRALLDPPSAPLDTPCDALAPLVGSLARAAGLRISVLMSAHPGTTGAAPLLLTIA